MRIGLAFIATLCLLTLAFGAAAEPERDDASCIEIALQSNGFHSNLMLPRAALAEAHPLVRLYPDARWFAVGWGDEDFYREPGGGTPSQGLRAVFTGGPTVVHVVAIDVAPEQYFGADTVVRAGVTRDGATRMAAFIDEEIARDEAAAAVVVGTGHHPNYSSFLRGSDDNFHLFNNCNHWAARGLRSAGLDVPGAITADGVFNRLRAIASRCQQAE